MMVRLVCFSTDTPKCLTAQCCPLCPVLFLITPTPQTLQPRAQNPGKSLQSPGRCSMEGMLNMSQHHSYSNMPISKWSNWLEGLVGMRKQRDSLPNRVHGKTWSNLHSYDIWVLSGEFMEGKRRKGEWEVEKERERAREREQGGSAICNVYMCCGYA